MPIGDILQASDLKAIQAESARSFKTQGYVAPTVFRLSAATTKGYNYYKSMQDAVKKLWFLANPSSQYAANSTPAGSVKFTADAKPQTYGINVDFFVFTSKAGWVPRQYAALRGATVSAMVFRFYNVDGTGPFWGIYDHKVFGMSATNVGKIAADKLAALEAFHREVQLLKSKHNVLASFLQQLSAKPSLNAFEQQTFNRGVLMLENFRKEIGQIKGVDIVYSKDGNIGVIPVIVWIAIAAVSAIAITWGAAAIVSEVQKSKRLNASYDMQKWVEDEMRKNELLVKEGKLSREAADRLNAGLKKTKDSAQDDANNTTESESAFGSIASMLKWAVGGFLGWKVLEAFSSSRKSAAK